MSTAQRPIPAPSAETKPFWEAAKNGQLRLAKCSQCQRIAYPPRPRCPDCLSEQLEWTTLSGKAFLQGWTDIHLPTLPDRTAPICLVECSLTEDRRCIMALLDETGSVRGCPPDTVLKITMQPDANGWSYPQVCVDSETAP